MRYMSEMCVWYMCLGYVSGDMCLVICVWDICLGYVSEICV